MSLLKTFSNKIERAIENTLCPRPPKEHMVEMDVETCKKVLSEITLLTAQEGIRLKQITLDWYSFESLFGTEQTKVKFPTTVGGGYILNIVKGTRYYKPFIED